VAKIPKRTPEEREAQLQRIERFRELLEKRLERDRELEEAAKRGEKPD
jgi:hypothetical protein